MDKQQVVEELNRKLALSDSGFMETSVFIAVFLCIFVVAWGMKNLLQGKMKKYEPPTEGVDVKLTWAMLISGSFMMLCAVYIMLTGFE